jgi:hypothetical protein
VRVIHIAGDSCHLTFSYFLPYYDLDLVVASVLPSFHGGVTRGVVAFVLVGVCLGEVSDRLAGCAGAAEAGGRDDAVAGAGVCPGEGPPTQPGVDRQARGDVCSIGT